MVLTDIILMPSKDYQSICDVVRAKTGETNLLKSGDIAELLMSISTDKLVWSFENDIAGSGYGVISLNLNQTDFLAAYDIYFADENGDILSPYGAITTLNANGYASFATHKQYAIPKGAKMILAVKDGVTVERFQIPEHKQITEEKKYSFGLVSDIHIDGDGDDPAFSLEDFEKELTVFETDGMDFCVVSGDVTQSGLQCDIDAFNAIKNAHSIPIYCSRGNHDTYNDCTIEKWNEIEPNGLYYEITHENDVFLFVGLTAEDVANPIAEYILIWLEEKLETYKNKRVFVIEHIFIEPCGNALGLYINLGILNTEGTNGRKFRDLMKAYRNVVFISGHSHFVFEMENGHPDSNIAARTDELCHRIHVPSGSRPRNVDDGVLISENAGALGYEVDVYENFLILRGMDFTAEAPVMLAQYYLDTTPILYEEIDEEEAGEYPYITVSSITSFESGSIDKTTGIDEESGSSYRTTEYILLNDNHTPTFKCNGKIIYFRVYYYDAEKNYLGYTNYFYDVYSASDEVFTIEPLTGSVYIRFKSQGAYVDMMFNGANKETGENVVISYRPPTVPLPEGTSFENIDEGEEPEDATEAAKWKALRFLKRQMNTSTMKSRIDFDTLSIDGCNMIAGSIPSLENPAVIQNKFVSTDKAYSHDYTGIISGKWYSSLLHPEEYRVDVYVITDMVYYGDSCELLPDGTWKTSRELTAGIKHIELVNKKTGIVREYGLPIVDNYTVDLFEYGDVEYLIGTAKIFISNGEYYFFSRGTYGDLSRIHGKIMDLDGIAVGISSNYNNIAYGRLPSSYAVPQIDPNFARDGNSALGKHGYMMNSRSFIYDAGLALLCFTVAGEYNICKEILTRMQYEQNTDGSFNFSYDNYVGKLFEDYIRTGSIGWLVWGGCYYTIKSGDTSFVEMLQNAGEWLLSRQVTDTSDARYGLLTGGVGTFDSNYVYSADEILWCSTEHNCSALQGLFGLYKITSDIRYQTAATLVGNALCNVLYDSENGRFYQGVNPDGTVDEAWSLDCTTWAGKMALSLGKEDIATACAATCKTVFALQDKTIMQSSEKEYFNMTYSLADDVTVNGFKPYADGYSNPPSLIWTEGTLGAVALFKALGQTEDAEAYLSDTIILQNCIGSSGGVIYTTATIANLPYEFHVWESAVSSAWLYLLLQEEDTLFCGEIQ